MRTSILRAILARVMEGRVILLLPLVQRDTVLANVLDLNLGLVIAVVVVVVVLVVLGVLAKRRRLDDVRGLLLDVGRVRVLVVVDMVGVVMDSMDDVLVVRLLRL